MAEKKQLLDLTLTFNRNTIRIEGEDYEIHHPDEFGLSDFAWIRERANQMFGALGGDMSVEEALKAETMIADILKKVFVEIPETTMNGIKAADKVEIITAFFSQFTLTKEEEKDKAAKEEPPEK